MGLFDNVYVDQPGFDPDEVFQTKDFDPYMHRYDITKDGRLIFTSWFEDDDGKGIPPEEMDFHGVLHFYTLRRNGEWVECEAKFTDGKLVNIKSHTVPKNAEVKA